MIGRRARAVRVYGIIGHGGAVAEQMPEGAHLLTFRDLGAVVGDVTPGKRGPGPPDVALHRALVAAVFAHRSIVPVSPGVVFRRADAVIAWLELHYAVLHDALRYVHGRVEARVHVRPRAGGGAPAARPEAGVDGRSDFTDAALEVLRTLGRDAASWILMPSADAGPSGRPDGRDVADISASFLVERSRWRELAAAVAAQADRGSGLEIALTGPWPPYDFVRLQFGG